MNSPKVSVVIPVYNQEQFLAETFESLFAQTYANLEIIAVDDGSIDESVRVLESFKDKRLFVKAQTNAGQAAAINTGIAMATGDLFKIMDGDDILNPKHIEMQVAAIAEQEGSVASSRWSYFVDDPATAGFVDEKTDHDYASPFDWIIDTLSDSRGMFGAWQWLIPRAVLDRSGVWNERLSLEADFEFTIRVLLAADSVCFAKEAKTYYRKGNAGSMSRVLTRDFLQSAVKATELSAARIVLQKDTELIRTLCADRFQKWAYVTYPVHSDLTEHVEKLIAQYGGSDLSLPGGRINHILGRFLPWRVIRQLQELVYKLGWQHVLHAKERRRIEKLQHSI